MNRKEEVDEKDYFLSPTIDFLFKRIFVNEKRLQSLLTAVLNEEVTQVQILNPELPRNFADLKNVTLDIRAILHGTTHVNIEMQMGSQGYYMKRTQYNLAKLYEEQLKKGGKYWELKQTIGINFLTEGSYGLPEEKWHTKYVLIEEELGTKMPDCMFQLHFIELAKLKRWKLLDESNLLVKWSLFMTAESMQDMMVVAQNEPVILEAASIVDQINKNKEERRLYEARLSFARNQEANQKAAEEDGIKKGIEIGREEGIEIGEKRGREEGIIQIAKAMLADGIPIEKVCTITGLTPEDLT